jgi:hypothetical protein
MANELIKESQNEVERLERFLEEDNRTEEDTKSDLKTITTAIYLLELRDDLYGNLNSRGRINI